eukprot:g2720.t1
MTMEQPQITLTASQITSSNGTTTFRDVVNELDSVHFDAMSRLCPQKDSLSHYGIATARSRTAHGSRTAPSLKFIRRDDAVSRTKHLTGMMAYTASLAFLGPKTPSTIAAAVHPKPHNGNLPLGVKEDLVDGSTIDHLSRDELRASMKYIVKIHLDKAENVIDRDRWWDVFSPESDPFVLFKHGMSKAQSKPINNEVNPTWDSVHYLFIRKNCIAKNPNEKMKVYMFDSDDHSLPWCRDDNESLEELQTRDDLLALKEVDLDFSRAPKSVKYHPVTFSSKRNANNKSMTLHFKTQILTVDEYINDVEKNFDDLWLDDRPLRNSIERGTNWMELLNSTSIFYTDIYPLAYINVDSTMTQAWIYGNLKEKILVLNFPATDPCQWKDLLANFQWNAESLGEYVEDKFSLKPKPEFTDSEALVHRGYKDQYLSIREIVLETLYSITNWSKDWLIISCGHSLGGSLASLAAYEIANRTTQNDEQPSLAMFTYGAPSVGNQVLFDRFIKSVPFGFRMVYCHDGVARYLCRMHRLGKAFPGDGSDCQSIEEFLNAQCGDEGDQRYENEDSDNGGIDLKCFDLANGFNHLESTYFKFINNVFNNLFPLMRAEQ